jgi:hypothetical protein
MTTVTFEQHGTVYTVRFNYSPVLVELIKTEVPHYARTWQPTVKAWTVEAGFARPLAATLHRLGYAVVGIDDPPHRQHATDSAEWARAVFRRVGPTRAPLAYKLLSRLCHPDHGGDHHLQLELNQAYAELPAHRRSA